MMPEGGRTPRYEEVQCARTQAPVRRSDTGDVGRGYAPDGFRGDASARAMNQGRRSGAVGGVAPTYGSRANCAIIPVPPGSATPALFSRICPCCAGFRPHDAAPRFRVLSRMPRSEEHTSELQSLLRISYAVFCFKKNKP